MFLNHHATLILRKATPSERSLEYGRLVRMWRRANVSILESPGVITHHIKEGSIKSMYYNCRWACTLRARVLLIVTT